MYNEKVLRGLAKSRLPWLEHVVDDDDTKEPLIDIVLQCMFFQAW